MDIAYASNVSGICSRWGEEIEGWVMDLVEADGSGQV
jgi:hypothetical protein